MNTKKYFYYIPMIFLVVIALANINCTSSHTKEDNPKTWQHFNILASSEDDIIFVQLQDDLGISPKMERYTLTVNITDKKNPIVIIGGEQNSSARIYSWSLLRKSVRQGLLNWTGSNKGKLE